jgi:hypothetical protein
VTVNGTPPKSEPPPRVDVQLDAEGRVRWDGVALTRDMLAAQLAYEARRFAATADRDRRRRSDAVRRVGRGAGRGRAGRPEAGQIRRAVSALRRVLQATAVAIAAR